MSGEEREASGRHRAVDPDVDPVGDHPVDLSDELLGGLVGEPVDESDGVAYGEPGAASRDAATPTGADALWAGPRRQRRRRRRGGCLPFLVVAVVLVVGGVAVWSQHGYANPVTALGHKINGAFSSGVTDYPGPGTGRVTFEVRSGDSITTMGQNLRHDGVVASVEAFTDAAGANPRSRTIQPGFYYLKSKMKASTVVSVLVNPKRVVSTAITIPEGFTVHQIVATLAAKTKSSSRAFEKVLATPGQLGLPAYAHGEVEGYLFPATYAFAPDATPLTMLRAMVQRFDQAAQDDGVVASAERLGYTPGQLITIASLVQAEGRGDDMPKIARVIDNRLSRPTASTAGFLGIDATINYALGRDLGVGLTQSELDVRSPYNTRLHQGLPPGPIDSPGDEALLAAGHPTPGRWLYYVTVDLRTGKTLFADTYQQFLRDKAQLTTYCQTSSAC